MRLHIKNMVCPRCILVVKQIFDDLELDYSQIRLEIGRAHV